MPVFTDPVWHIQYGNAKKVSNYNHASNVWLMFILVIDISQYVILWLSVNKANINERLQILAKAVNCQNMIDYTDLG